MKQRVFKLSISLLLVAMLASCGNATETAKQTQSAIKASVPGAVPTTATGYMMNAKRDGKYWSATSMMPPDAAGRIIGYNNGEYIGLPYNSRGLVVGKKEVFGEDNAVDLATNDKESIWGGRKGEMEITKLGDDWAEGKFFFTAIGSRSGKTMEITEGFFRIPLVKIDR